MVLRDDALDGALANGGPWRHSTNLEEVTGMSEMKATQGEMGAAAKKAPEFGWRQGVVGAGLFLLVVSLFISAGTKGSLGQVPLYVACLGALFILVAAVAGIVARLSATSRSAQDRAA
jgi:hypothetical protein